MPTQRIEIGKRNSGRLGDLTFHSDRCLLGGGSVEIRRNLVDGRFATGASGLRALNQIGGSDAIRKVAGGVLNDNLPLR